MRPCFHKQRGTSERRRRPCTSELAGKQGTDLVCVLRSLPIAAAVPVTLHAYDWTTAADNKAGGSIRSDEQSLQCNAAHQRNAARTIS